MNATRSELGARDVLLLVGLAGIWGFTFLLIELAVATLSPLWVVTLRTLTGYLVLQVIVGLRSQPFPRGRLMWIHLVVLAALGNVLPWTLVAWAQQSITSGLTAVLYSLIPVMTLLISVLSSMERWTPRKLIGLVVASLGTAVVVGFEPSTSENPGAIAGVLIACASLAVSAVYAKRYITSRVRPLPMATAQLAISVVSSLVLAVLLDPIPTVSDFQPSVIVGIVLLGAVATGFAFLIYYTLIDRVGATNATLVTYLTPVIGLLAGWLILDEPVGPSLFAGLGIIIAGIWFAQRRRPVPGLPVIRP